MLVTVALPAYDEVGSLESVVQEAISVLSAIARPEDGEVLIVDDGSADGTSELADRLAAAHPGVRCVHHERNRGFTGAMATCFREARGEWVFLAPADGQTRLDVLPRFLELAREADVVIGVRAKREDAAIRLLLSRSFHLIARVLFALPLREFSSAFLFRRALLDAMPFRSRPRGATILPEILFRARCRGAVLATLEVPHYPRRAGRAKGGQLSVALLTLLELVRIAALARWDEKRGVRRAAP